MKHTSWVTSLQHPISVVARFEVQLV